MRRRIQEMNLSGLYPVDRIRVHLHRHFRIGMAAADTGTRYVMRLLRQVLRNKHFVAGLHHAGIVHVYVLHEEPGTDTVVRQFASLFH